MKKKDKATIAPDKPDVNNESPPPPPPSKPKFKKIHFHCKMAAAIGGETLPGWIPFPLRFHVLKDKSGAHQYIQEHENQVISYVAMQKLVDGLKTYYKRSCQQLHDLDIAQKDFTDSIQYWASVTPGFEHEIAPVRLKSEPGYCWHRLDFDFCRGEFPVWQEFLDRTSNSEALQAWIYSLLIAESYGQQYVWIWGRGKNGKGSILRVLKKILGDASKGCTVPKNDKHWTSSLLGKRLLTFPDCKEYSFPTTDIFKQITGGDEIDIRGLFKTSYSTYLPCKVILTSNGKPILSSAKADTRRAIYCASLPATQNFGKNYEQLLWEQTPAFLMSCKDVYERLCPEHEEIPVEETSLDLITAMGDERFEVLFEKHFKRAEEKMFITAGKLQEILNSEGIKDSLEISDFKDWLERTHLIIPVRAEIGGIKSTRYFGMLEKLPSEKEKVKAVYKET